MTALSKAHLVLNSRHPRRNLSGSRSLSFFIVVAVLLGCTGADDSPTAPSIASSAGPSFTIAPALPSGRPKTLDEVFAEIATHVPGYAGTYYAKDGTPITNLVDLSQSAAAEQAIAPFIRGGKNGTGVLKSQFRKVSHDSAKVNEWKGYATRNLLLRPNVIFVDIDEENNQLNIGVRSQAETGPVKRFLNDNHIPGGVALVIPVDTSPGYQVNPSVPETLRNTQSLYGGVQILPGAVKQCTLSFNAMLSSDTRIYSYDHFFVTNAHCMNSVGYPQNTPIYQNNDQNGSTRIIGYEFRQPLWEGSERYTNCPAGSRCSMAEVALVKYTVPWGGSRIARTTYVGAGRDTGSVTLDPYALPWQVVDSVNDHTLFQGSTIMKVGRTAGWTQGTTTQTCADYRLWLGGYPTQFVILCQWSGNFTSRGGDSGSPVFKYKFGYYPQVQLVGTVWAGDYGVSTFSFFPYISWELTFRDTQYACGTVFDCTPKLAVSGQ